MLTTIENGKVKIQNASVSKDKAKQLFEEYAEKFDPKQDPDKQEVWQYNKILQWLRGTKGFNDADAKFIKAQWDNNLGYD